LEEKTKKEDVKSEFGKLPLEKRTETLKDVVSEHDIPKKEGILQKLIKLKQKKKTVVDYRSDKSITSVSGDKFKHSHYVKVLKDILTKCETPINIGLYGRWGVGKSSILHMLKEEIEKGSLAKDFRYVEVDAWGLSADTLQQGILEEINSDLKTFKQWEIEDKLFNVHEVDSVDYQKTMTKYWPFWSSVIVISIAIFYFGQSIDLLTKLSAVGLTSILATLFPLFKMFVGTTKKIIPRAVSSFQFNRIYKEMVDSEKKTLVVVIDNLDRCEDKVAVELLGIIQTFMAKEDCINILACDDEAIINHLHRVKGDSYTEREGNEFLSKFFQVTVTIPPFIGENLESYTEELMGQRSVPFDPFIRQILISGAVQNPRKINQFLNNAVALYRLAEFKENDGKLPKGIITKHTDFLTKILVIKHEWPVFYKELDKNPEVMKDNKILGDWINEQKADHVDGLVKFLNTTQFSMVDDIIPFLRLNQETYAAESDIDEFATAVNNNDQTIVLGIFKKSDARKQSQYLKKIEAINTKHTEKGDVITLVNSTFSLIGIIEVISEPLLRKIAIAELGKCLSTTLLDQIEKYNVGKLIPLLEEMVSHFATKIYQKILSLFIKEEKLNTVLIKQLFSNSNTISASNTELIDSKLEELYEEREEEILSLLPEICDSEWQNNNIPKPSNVIYSLISNIALDNSEIDNKRLECYRTIHNVISNSEKDLFIENLADIINNSNKSSSPIPPQLFELFDEFEIIENENHEPLVKLYDSMLDSTSKNPDVEQKKNLFKILIKLENRLREGIQYDEKSYREKLQSSLSEFLKSGNHDLLLWFIEFNKELEENLLSSPIIISGFIENFERNGPTNADILRYILAETPYETRDKIKEFIEKSLSSETPEKYSVILTVIQQDDVKINDDLKSELQEIVLKRANETEYPENFQFYEAGIKLDRGGYYSKLRDISEKILSYINKEDPTMQNSAFNLLNLINKKIDTKTEQIGVRESLSFAEDYLSKNDMKTKPFLDFIFSYLDLLSWSQEDSLLDIFKNNLVSEKPHPIRNLMLDFLPRLNKDDQKKLINNVLKLAELSPEAEIKNKCKQIIVSLKEELSLSKTNKAKELFGEKIFG